MSKTKKSLLLSCLSMLLCVTMLIGSTFAWFTDNATTGVNTIQAGTLDIGLYEIPADKVFNMSELSTYTNLENDKLSFRDANGNENILWEPGATFVTPDFTVVNKGNLAAKAKITINGIDGNNKLLEVIKFKMEVCIYGYGSANEVWDSLETLAPTGEIEIAANQPYTALRITAKMDENAGNEYQGLKLEGVGITVQATQNTVETDSFNNQYDKDATYSGEANENWYDENATTLEITSAADLHAFANEVNVNGNSFAGKTVKLTADIDLANADFTPIGQTGGYSAKTYFQGTFDGNGKTIKNLKVSVWEAGTNEGKHYASGLFGFIDAGSATIKNLTVDGATVNGAHWTGVIAGYLTGTVENCTVKNATVTCTHKNDEACGDKAGAVVGYINEGTVKNCTAENCTVTAGRDAGQIVGAAKTTQVTNCTATHVTVSAGSGCTGDNIRNEVIGRVL